MISLNIKNPVKAAGFFVLNNVCYQLYFLEIKTKVAFSSVTEMNNN